MTLRKFFATFAALSLSLAASFIGSQTVPTPTQQTWRFDDLHSLGGNHTKIEGTPQLIDTPAGKAIAFNGVDSALFVAVHPLAGAAAWTWEMVFRPDADGKPEQRIFHLQSMDSATGQDIPDERMLFEIRIRTGSDGKPGWCLDSFATAGGQSRALLNCDKLYPFGPWYRVTAVYDGHTFSNYVGDELQGSGPLAIPAQCSPGRSSIGTRIDRRDYFKGAIYAGPLHPACPHPRRIPQEPAGREVSVAGIQCLNHSGTELSTALPPRQAPTARRYISLGRRPRYVEKKDPEG